jgi:hypothetical protein
VPDISLDQFVAQAVEPMPLLPPFDAATDAKLDYVPESPLRMWFYDAGWYAGTVQESMDRSMRAYELFWERTGWRLIQLKHVGQETWTANILNQREDKAWKTVTGHGSTAAIAICEAIKAASLADAELSKTAETEVRG